MSRNLHYIMAVLLVVPAAHAQGVISPVVHPVAQRGLLTTPARAPGVGTQPVARGPAVPARFIAQGNPPPPEAFPRAAWNPFNPPVAPPPVVLNAAPLPPPPPPESAFDKALHDEQQEIISRGVKIGVINGKALYRYHGRYALESVTSISPSPAPLPGHFDQGQCVINIVAPVSNSPNEPASPTQPFSPPPAKGAAPSGIR